MDSAIMINKNIDFFYNNRGVLRMRTGLIEEALSDFEEAVKLTHSTNSDMLFNCAFVKYKLGNNTEALTDCDKALRLLPNNKDLLNLKEKILNNTN
jgi:tetratricopeptide (TPR) repeat protein